MSKVFINFIEMGGFNIVPNEVFVTETEVECIWKSTGRYLNAGFPKKGEECNFYLDAPEILSDSATVIEVKDIVNRYFGGGDD